MSGTPMEILAKLLSFRSSESASQEPRFLRDLPGGDLEKVVAIGDAQRLEAGAVMVSEGQRDTPLYIVIEGWVEVFVPTKQEWLRVAVLGPGSVVGEMAFLDQRPRSARIVATTDCLALRLTREAYEELALRDPALALRIVWDLSGIVAFRLRRLERFDAAEIAREEERKTLAGELHDEIMADLGALAVEVAFMKRQASSLSPTLESGLETIRGRLMATDRRLREIVQGIYPSALAVRGLVPALHTYLSDLSARAIGNPTPLEIALEIAGFNGERLPERVEIAIYRVIQQGVANVLQHARAKRLRISVIRSDSGVAFALADDGVGFDVNNPKEGPPTGHFGLANLRDRVERLGGRLEIESQTSVGTTVRGLVPVPSAKPCPTEIQASTFVLLNQQHAGGS